MTDFICYTRGTQIEVEATSEGVARVIGAFHLANQLKTEVRVDNVMVWKKPQHGPSISKACLDSLEEAS